MLLFLRSKCINQSGPALLEGSDYDTSSYTMCYDLWYQLTFDAHSAKNDLLANFAKSENFQRSLAFQHIFMYLKNAPSFSAPFVWRWRVQLGGNRIRSINDSLSHTVETDTVWICNIKISERAQTQWFTKSLSTTSNRNGRSQFVVHWRYRVWHSLSLSLSLCFQWLKLSQNSMFRAYCKENSDEIAVHIRCRFLRAIRSLEQSQSESISEIINDSILNLQRQWTETLTISLNALSAKLLNASNRSIPRNETDQKQTNDRNQPIRDTLNRQVSSPKISKIDIDRFETKCIEKRIEPQNTAKSTTMSTTTKSDPDNHQMITLKLTIHRSSTSTKLSFHLSSAQKLKKVHFHWILPLDHGDLHFTTELIL